MGTMMISTLTLRWNATQFSFKPYNPLQSTRNCRLCSSLPLKLFSKHTHTPCTICTDTAQFTRLLIWLPVPSTSASSKSAF